MEAQVGINTPTPDPSSILDIVSNTKGVLLPRMTSAERNAINAPVAGLLVFDTSMRKFSGYDGTQWTQNVFGTKWETTGNSGTDPNINFLGTTDNKDLSIITNNALAMTVKSSGQIRMEGLISLNVPRLTVDRPLQESSIPSIVASVDNGPDSAYPVNIITENLVGGSSGNLGRVFGNYAFALNGGNAVNGISQGGMSYVYSANTSVPNSLLFYAGGSPATEKDTSKEVMFLGSNKSIYIGYPSWLPMSTGSYPQSKVNVAGGDVYISNIGSGVIMTSPSGNCFRLTIDNTGAIASISVPCP
ncbi:hypothetical protein EG347_02165 [Chryseobacterium sp. G0186]|nr:hypothetical protein EG347_02165 [Chryseobacterium sp. G0186]